MTDIGPQRQESPLAQNIDISCASELRLPGSFPVLAIRDHTSALKTSLPADHGDFVTSSLQDLSRFKHATEYFIPSLFNGFEIYPHAPSHIDLALDKFRNELSNIWSSLSKFARVERNARLIAVVAM